MTKPSWQQWAWFVLGVAVTGVIALVAQSAVISASKSTEIRSTQQSNVKKIDATNETLRLVRDCVTPGGACFDRGQKQTAKAVGDINRVVILAAACSVGLNPHATVLERQNVIQECVIRRLAAKP